MVSMMSKEHPTVKAWRLQVDFTSGPIVWYLAAKSNLSKALSALEKLCKENRIDGFELSMTDRRAIDAPLLLSPAEVMDRVMFRLQQGK